MKLYNLIKWPSEDAYFFRKILFFVRAYTKSDAFTMIGQANFRIAEAATQRCF